MNSDGFMAALTDLLDKNDPMISNLAASLDKIKPQITTTNNQNSTTKKETKSNLAEESNFGIRRQQNMGNAMRTNGDEWQKRQLLILDKELKEDLEFTNCTFKPQINSSKTQARYMIPVKKSPKEKIDEECTFKPAINAIKQGTKLNEYLSKKPHERLTKRNRSPVINNKPPIPPKPTGNIEDFINRQQVCELYKKQKLDYLIEEANEKMSPKIGKKSEAIAAKLGDFESRMKLLSLRKKQRSPRNEEEANWFRPKINTSYRGNKTYRRSPKTTTSPRNKPTTTKETEKSFSSTMSKSKEYDNIGSKLQLKNNLDTLIKRIKCEQNAKERISSKAKELKNLEEELDCTYRPKLTSVPSYLKHRNSAYQ